MGGRILVSREGGGGVKIGRAVGVLKSIGRCRQGYAIFQWKAGSSTKKKAWVRHDGIEPPALDLGSSTSA